MRFEKFTNRLQQALSDAQSLATGKDHTSIDGIHILSVLLEEPSNLSLLQQSGARLPELKKKAGTGDSGCANHCQSYR